MKARVKATGEIIELCNLEFDEDGNEYYRDELELIGDYDPDYWEKLKHQYAGMFLQGIIIRNAFHKDYVEDAYKYAAALVNKLKEESLCEK